MKIGKVKTWQISSILRTIYKQPGITRMELSNILNIDRSMITHLINNLKVDNWIDDPQTSAKRIPLRLNKDRILTAGVEIQPQFQSIVICNLSGEILINQKWNQQISDINFFLKVQLPIFLESTNLNINAIGIAIPGPYDKESNKLLSSQPFNIIDPYPLLSKIPGIQLPIFFDNDARCSAWGIVSFNKEKDNFLLLLTEFDEHEEPSDEYRRIVIGSALFLNQKAYEGSHFCAGEFKSLFRVEDGQGGQLSIPHTERVKMKTDPVLLNQFIEELGIHMGFLTNFLDLEKIYIGGSLEKHKDLVERQFGTYMLNNSLYPHLQKTKIMYAGMGDLTIARGAAGLAYERLFKEPVMEETNLFYKEVLKNLTY